MGGVNFRILSIDLLERDVRLRMPFRFGVVTLTESPQAFVRVRIANGNLSIGSLDCAGYASAALPDWKSMREM